ncbi:MAG: hypothetical protein ACP5LP_02355 [Candidatus Micrarchaeia archaeon]
MPVSIDDLLIFKKRNKNVQANNTSEISNANAADVGQAPFISDNRSQQEVTNEELEANLFLSRNSKKTKLEEKSRKEAANLYCVWHPWKKAYAICNYCHRPFCYEDLEEYNGAYYCLEDINKIEQKDIGRVEAVYTWLNFITAILFLSMLVVFAYFANNMGLFLIKKIAANISFLLKVFYYPEYLIYLLEVIFEVLGVVAAIYIFLESKKGFYIGIVTSIFDTIVFSYMYFSENEAHLYLLAMAAMGFMSLLFIALPKAFLKETGDSLINTSFYNSQNF